MAQVQVLVGSEQVALELPEGAIRDARKAIQAARELKEKLGKLDFSKLIDWWSQHGDQVISIVTTIIALFGSEAKKADEQADTPVK